MNDYFQKRVHYTWLRVFNDNYLRIEFQKIMNHLVKYYFLTDTNDFRNYANTSGGFKKLYPIFSDILRCFRVSNFDSIKLIIIGSSPPPLTQYQGLPWSLDTTLNYNTILSKEYDNFSVLVDNLIKNKLTTNINLTPSDLIQKGVFLLFSALTIDTHSYHNDLWEAFMTRLIYSIQDVNKNIVFIALGDEAQKLMKSTIIDQTNVLYDVRANSFASNYGKLLNSDVFSKAFKLIENNTNEIFTL